MLSFEELQKKSEENWARVPEEKRAACVRHLRRVIHPVDQEILREEFREKKGFGNFHFSATGGMGVRNTLREVMKDDELPPVKYTHEKGDREFRNWDDFYMAALRQAVAPREDEV